ncbi:precorrin-2 C20-methyltransferase [Actibacterium mucosum KCTC 23349]|uniref:Precorrin-2 C20-methyltransferase n=1 Tax=Actibacterium mucosum KCTC 23349 TaxID=1454373 RepID=A0A037ZGA7_9RHOB|nr:precorrin-2 C(20)-methyltransferase [Actibacterium mucosum]KAJ55178.1 precorrin-2 C20-methyltransferase [Actibacterium mucosum KCTC 23349]
MSGGTIYGLGLGPGDPELMSVKAHRLLRETRHVAFFRKAGRKGQARQIVEGLLREDVIEVPMEYPVTTEIPLTDPRYNQTLAAFYAECVDKLRALVEAGIDVVVLCEGDPFFYGSFMHLHARLVADVTVEVVPAITGMSGAWTATGQPVTWGDDVMCVLMGTLDEDTLTDHMTRADALVVMKIGRNFDKVCRALKSADRFADAWLVEYAQMPNQTVRKLAEAEGAVTPYFSIIIVHGQGRRP